MTMDDFLAAMAQLLEMSGIPFMVAGSYGSSHHGEPRNTHDVDLVVDPTREQLDSFLALLGDRYYVRRDAALDALRQRGMFNIIDFDEGWKADLIVRKDRPFSVEEFQRRRTAVLAGRPLPVVSPEDVILTKLEWNRITPSDRQLKDTFGVITAQAAKLDRTYLRRWAPILGVEKELEELLRKAEDIQPGEGP